MIEATGLTKRYGAYRALDRVSFEVRRGEVVGFLGPNGAGKSTTMRILTCYLSATSGSVKVHGYDVFDEPLAVREKIGYLPQRAQMYGEMGVLEYLRFVADVRGIDVTSFNKRMRNIVEVCGLGTVLGKDIRQLSHGYRQRVGLGQALIHNPPILILDEPTSDLDPNEKAEVIEYIKEIGKDRTVILSTHNLAEVEEACARAIIISKGRVVADGAIDEVRARGGRVRYQVLVDEKAALRGTAPSSADVEAALAKIQGAISVKELPTDDRCHGFTLLGNKGSDLRGEIFKLCVDKGWVLLEMRRDIQKLEDVFKSLTKGDEVADRLRTAAPDEDEESEDEGLEDDESEDEESDASEDEESDDDADEKDSKKEDA
ncbi:MAG: ATP-binding cassette domain-containing protein [Deltaproteobacteria bacterium]|nr:ATP-binding cassette domain-containing protein [Deltaproteobacteria bacterium]